MKRLLVSLIAVAGLIATSGMAQAKGIIWVKSYAAAITEARRTNRLVMADFYTDWCTWCKRLDADTYSSDGVIEATKQVIAVKINAEKEGVAQAVQFHIASFPTVLFIDASGRVEGKIGGYETAVPFTQHVNEIVKRHRDLPLLESKFGSDPSPQLAAQLTEAYAGQGNPSKATQMLAQVAKMDPDGSKGYLAKSMLHVADMYLGNHDFDHAIALFHKALKVATTPHDKAYAHYNIAMYSLVQNKIDDAVPQLKAILAVKNGPDDLKQNARKILTRIDQLKKQPTGFPGQ